MIRTGDPQRINAIEYLRGLSSVAVAWFHVTNGYDVGSVVATVGSLGWIGVDVFFVISGFIIPFSLWRRQRCYDLAAFRSFMGKRVLRIEVPYLISILATIVLWHISHMSPYFRGGSDPYSLGQIVANIFYIVPFTGHTWLQPVYWTLGFEFLFYFTIGAAYGVLIGKRGLWIWLVSSTGLIIMVLVGILPGLLLLFVMGFSLFRTISKDNSLGLCSVVVLICGFIMAFVECLYPAIAGIVTVALIYFGIRLSPSNGRLHKAGLFLGTISYSLYLTHVLVGGRVINLGRRITNGPAEEFLLSLAALAVSVGAAAVFHSLVERPAVRLSRRFASSVGKLHSNSAGLRNVGN